MTCARLLNFVLDFGVALLVVGLIVLFAYLALANS